MILKELQDLQRLIINVRNINHIHYGYDTVDANSKRKLKELLQVVEESKKKGPNLKKQHVDLQ